LLATMPSAKVLLADRGYDADWLRDALAERQTEACT
jgi:transposase